ncbi:MAG TPA: methyl-accepting chemotaxis protein [Cellvibrionaceae bacterium]
MSKPLSIAQRLSLGFGLILLLLIVVTLLGIQRVGVIDATLAEVSQGASQKQRFAINFRGSVHDRAIAIRDAVLVDTQSALNSHLREVERLDKFYQDSAIAMDTLFAEQAVSDQERQLLRNIKTIEITTNTLTRELIDLRLAGNSEQARQFLLSKVSPAYSAWLADVNAFIDYQEAAIRHDVAEVQDIASGFGVTMVLFSGLALVASVVVSLLIIRNVKSTLGAEPHEVSAAVEQLAAGQLSVNQHSAYPNSVMGRVNQMATRLAGIIQEVRDAALQLSQASEQLNGTSNDNNIQIQRQSSEIEQMATAINQMTLSVTDVSRNAGGAASATQKADREVATGSHTVKNTASAIQQLAETLEGATEKVQTVSEQSGDIEKIVEVINAIAEQTNLLALNAAIEAARAGEHGRGFAVVADEVRSLANRTQQSTREIRSMIATLQEGSSSAAEVMLTSRKLAQNTVAQTQASELALESIRREVLAITDMNTQIASAAEEQSQVAENVNQNINRISAATLASSSGSNQVAESSKVLAQLAEQLSQKVSYFQLASTLQSLPTKDYVATKPQSSVSRLTVTPQLSGV